MSSMPALHAHFHGKACDCGRVEHPICQGSIDGVRIIGRVLELLLITREHNPSIHIVAIDRYELIDQFEASLEDPRMEMYEASLVDAILSYTKITDSSIGFVKPNSDYLFDCM